MWSKKGIPVETEDLPVPSITRFTEILVSRVCRLSCARLLVIGWIKPDAGLEFKTYHIPAQKRVPKLAQLKRDNATGDRRYETHRWRRCQTIFVQARRFACGPPRDWGT